ncbi:UNVERIFIED_CONTAM: RNA-binding protein [Hammondia hammondi]|eukprot:XP_008887328.1 RNA-binding protein [Hammondia hammondi]
MATLPAADPSQVNAPANANVQAVWKLNELELRHNLTGEASWHWQYRESSYIFIGGLDVRLTEGDIIIVFSQWGEPIDIHLVRDKKTGAPKGFCFLAYEDQRSTVLAVDNANGMKLLNGTLRVDHCKNYRPPRKDDDDAGTYEATGAEGGGIGVYRVTEDEKKKAAALAQAERLQKETEALQTKMGGRRGKDVDEMWAEEFEEMLKKVNEDAEEEAKEVLRAERRKQKEEKKREKKEMKKRRKEAKRRRLNDSLDGDREREGRRGDRRRDGRERSEEARETRESRETREAKRERRQGESSSDSDETGSTSSSSSRDSDSEDDRRRDRDEWRVPQNI